MARVTAVAVAAGMCLLVAVPASAQCGGICLYENGSPDLGRAGAGAGARAQDASTVLWNPAGMTELPDHEILFGVIASFGKLNPELSAGTVTPDPPPRGGGNASGFAPLLGGAISALVKPREGTRIGLYYRTRIKADTQGNVEGPAAANPTVDTDFTFPQGVNVSLFQKLGDAWALLADAGWSDWSEFSNIPLEVGPVGATQRRGWNDTWRLGAGFQYTPSEKWTLQGGFGYDSSPVKASRLLPDIPASEQYRFSAGLQLRPRDYLEISLSYQFLWFGPMSIHQVSLPPSGTTVLNGKYDPAWAQFAGVSLRVGF
jgi:long-chain fatty acid transport protein